MSVILREGKISPVISVTRYLIIGGYFILLWVPLLFFPLNWVLFLVFPYDPAVESEQVLLKINEAVKISHPLANVSIEDPMTGLISYWISLAHNFSSSTGIFFLINLILIIGFTLDPVIGYFDQIYHKTLGIFLDKSKWKPFNWRHVVVILYLLLLIAVITLLNEFLIVGIGFISAVILVFVIPYGVLRKYLVEPRFSILIDIEREGIALKKKKGDIWNKRKEEYLEKLIKAYNTAKNENKKQEIFCKMMSIYLERQKALQEIRPTDTKIEKYFEFLFAEPGRTNSYDSLWNWRWKTNLVLQCHLITITFIALNLFIFFPLLLGLEYSGLIALEPPTWGFGLFLIFCCIMELYLIGLMKEVRNRDLALRSFKETVYTLFLEKNDS